MAYPRRTFLESVLAVGFMSSLRQDAEETPDFDFSAFLGPLRSKSELTKIVLNIPSNKENSFGDGVFVNEAASFKQHEIDDKPTLKWIGASFGTVLRMFDGHTIGSYLTKGSIELHIGKTKTEIEITQLGFCPANQYPTDHVVFYSWPLAKLIDDLAIRQSKSGMAKTYFSVLSGELNIERDKLEYAKLFGEK